MTELSTPLSIFTKQMVNFSIELTEMYPQDTSFKAIHNGLMLLKSTNPRLIAEKFINNVHPFKQDIFTKNEKLFLDMDYDEYTKQFQNGIMIMKTLKNYWKELSQESKDCMWTYFKVLITLSERI